MDSHPENPVPSGWQSAIRLLESSLKQSWQEHTAQLNDHKGKVAEWEAKYAKLQGGLTSKEERVQQLEEEKKLRIEQHQSQVSRGSETADILRRELQTLQEQNRALQKAADEETQKAAALKGKLDEKKRQESEQILLLQGKLEKLQGENERLGKTAEERTGRADGLQTTLEEQSEKLSLLGQELETARRDNKTWRQTAKEQRQRADDLQLTFDAKTKEYETLAETTRTSGRGNEEKLVEKQRQLDTSQKQELAARNTIRDLQANLEMQSSETKRLNAQLRATQETLELRELGQLAELSVGSEALHQEALKENERLSKDLKKTRKELESVDQQLSAERNTIKSVNERVVRMGDEHKSQLEKKKTETREQIIATEITPRDREIKELRQQLDNQQSRINGLKEQLDESGSRNEELNEQVEELQREREEFVEDKQNLQRQLNRSANAAQKELTRQVEQLQSERDGYIRQLATVSSHLRDSQEAQKRQNQEMKSQVEEAKSTGERLREQRTKLDEAETERSRLSKTLEKIKGENQRLSAQRFQSRADGGELQKLQKSISERDEEISEREAELERLHKKLADIRSFAFELKRISMRSRADDGEIRDRLEYQFRDGTRVWARYWAARSFDGNLGKFTLGELGSEFQKVAEVQKDLTLVQQLQAIHPRVMVDALLSYYLVDRIFQFYSQRMGEQTGDKSGPMDQGLSKVLTEFYKMFVQEDEEQADRWRSQTVSLLAKSKPSSLEDTTVTRFQGDLTKLAESFLQSPVQLFLKAGLGVAEEKERKEQLIQLIKTTLNLAIYINHKRSGELQIRGIKWCRENDKMRDFRHDSPHLKADQSHHIDPGNKRLDSAKIRMVVKPGFFVSEREEADPKVWVKTVVLLQEVE